MMNRFEQYCRKNFNEPVLVLKEVGRLVGYAEDDHDHYFVVDFAVPKRRTYHSFVGGPILLHFLKQQGVVNSPSGERYDDYRRTDSLLQLNGAPRLAEFVKEVLPKDGDTYRVEAPSVEERAIEIARDHGMVTRKLGDGILACDGLCSKAWGINHRPQEELDPNNVDDYAFFSDGELGTAPINPGTYEGGDGKPRETDGPGRMNKWCYRECERSFILDSAEMFRDPLAQLPDFTKRRFNIPNLHRQETVAN